ncbi:MAG: glycosyltransferase family 39 protein [Planctomycetaceae bacterium]|nr:glycosyltransferase family 39 protein [Planctomycetaceae bacterium]
MVPTNEKKLILVITLLAAMLRLWGYSAVSIEHFDEGVYASNIWFDQDEGYRYPDRHLYAPPLVPTLIEWGHVILGPTSLATILPGLLAGIATIPLLWWFGRQIAGPFAGLCAASLLATNEAHILYSRTALTEPLLCFWMLLSVYLAHQALTHLLQGEKSDLKTGWLAGFAGLTAGLAWLSKYNGWLALAVIVSASLAWGLFSKFTVKKWSKLAAGSALIVLVAFLVWLPYLSALQKFGGYAAVAGNHQQYFVGLAGWQESLFAQLSKQFQLLGITSACGFGIVGVLVWKRSMWITPQKTPHSFSLAQISLGSWMTASWLIGLSVAIPLYYPYPRLCAPWMIAFCLATGLIVSKLCQGGNVNRTQEQNPSKKHELQTLLSVILLAGVSLIGPLRLAPAWEPRNEYRRIATKCVMDAGEIAKQQGHAAEEVVFYVYGEPAMFYHLSAADRLTGPIGHLDFAKPGASRVPFPTFLVVGPHALRSDLFHEQWKELGDHFQLIAEYQYHPSLLVQLNKKDGDQEKETSLPVKLYQLK